MREAETSNIDNMFNFKPNLFQKIWWLIMRFFKDVVPDIPYKIECFAQRGYRGWSKDDWWNMDYYLISIIIPMLKELKEKSHGYPGHGEASTPEKWEAFLGKMIEGFEAAKRVWEDEYYLHTGFPDNRFDGDVKQWQVESEIDQKIFKKKAKIFIDRFFSLWD